MNGTADRLPLGPRDRGRARVVVLTLGNSSYRCVGLEPVFARKSQARLAVYRLQRRSANQWNYL